LKSYDTTDTTAEEIKHNADNNVDDISSLLCALFMSEFQVFVVAITKGTLVAKNYRCALLENTVCGAQLLMGTFRHLIGCSRIVDACRHQKFLNMLRTGPMVENDHVPNNYPRFLPS
jgi:inosine-uridine nucleoside N-ribohydrolase